MARAADFTNWCDPPPRLVRSDLTGESRVQRSPLHRLWSLAVAFKNFLTFSFVGLLLSGAMIGSLVEDTNEPILQGALLGAGVWLTLIGLSFLKET